jgi:hypothetical protein
MAKTMDISLRSIQCIWQAQELYSRTASEPSNARAIPDLQRPITVPSSTLSAANKVVVPWRL